MGEMISVILAIIFFCLALLHFAWMAGMKWGLDSSLPSNLEGKRVLNPKPVDCLLVGAGLSMFSFFYLSFHLDLRLVPSETIEKIILWLIPSIFLIRAIGDFKYLGIFKKVKGTKFGKTDTSLIIPLCLIIALLGYLKIFIVK